MKAPTSFFRLLIRALVVTGCEPFETLGVVKTFLRKAPSCTDMGDLARLIDRLLSNAQTGITVQRMTAFDLLLQGRSRTSEGKAAPVAFWINLKLSGSTRCEVRVRMFSPGSSMNAAIADCTVELLLDNKEIRPYLREQAGTQLGAFRDKAASVGQALPAATILAWFEQYGIVAAEPRPTKKKETPLQLAAAAS